MCRINHLKPISALRKLSSDIQIWTVFSAFVFSIGLPFPACILFLFFLPHPFLLSFHFCLDTLSMGYSMSCTLFIWFWHQWKPVSEDVRQIPNLLSDVVNHTHTPPSVSHLPLIRSCAQVLLESYLVFPFPPMLTLSASLSESLFRVSSIFPHIAASSWPSYAMTHNYSSVPNLCWISLWKMF